jgi:hypothetical protein
VEGEEVQGAEWHCDGVSLGFFEFAGVVEQDKRLVNCI